MEFEINTENYKDFLKDDNQLVIDADFIRENKIESYKHIRIMGIHNKNVVLYAKDIEFLELNIEIKDSSLYGIFFENVTIKDLKLLSLEISEYKNAKFKSFKTYFDNSNIGSIWLHNSTFFNGFLLRNKSSVRTIRLNDCSIDYSFTYMDSKSAEITVESSILDDLNFENVDINKKGISVSIDKINIFRTEVKTGFRIWDVEFKELHFHRVNILRNEGLSHLKKDIHITVPERCQEVNKIDIRECNIEKRLSITLNNINEINSHDSNFLFLGISFWKILSFNCVKNLFQDGVSWGYQNQLKTIEKFVFENCEVRGRFYLSYTYFDKLLKIHGTSFNSYPSFFNSNTISDSCDVDFEYTNLKNFVFQNINFKNVSFKNIDIDNVEFQNCEWDSIDKCFFSRLKVKDENKSNSEIKNLIDNKNIYSKLISSFQKNNDYINSGKFYISEQEAKRAISLKSKSYIEYVFLSLHKGISSYGESLTKPLLLLVTLVIIFGYFYLFSGFYSEKRLINYEFYPNLSNTFQTLYDFVLSLIYGVKNIFPFSIDGDFFLNNNNLKWTQVIELIQKILSIVIIGSLTESFVRYLKK